MKNRIATHTPKSRIDLKLLLELMDRDGWTSNAIEYVERAVNSHDELLEMVDEMYSAITNGHALKFTHDDYKQAIAKAEGK